MTVKMKTISWFSICKKCGCSGATVRYFPSGRRIIADFTDDEGRDLLRNIQNFEVMLRTCKICGFQWFESPGNSDYRMAPGGAGGG